MQVGRSGNFSLWLATQDIASVKMKYHLVWDSIFENMHNQIFFNFIGRTTKIIIDSVGKKDVKKISTSSSKGNASQTVSHQEQNILTADKLRSLPVGTAYVVVSGITAKEIQTFEFKLLKDIERYF